MWGCLADEHVAGALLTALRQAGVDTVSVIERGMRGQPDEIVAATALHEQRLILTNDTDYIRLSSAAASRGAPFAPVVFWPQQSRGTGYLLGRIRQLVDEPDYTTLYWRVIYL
jgi:hypothetical protein